jgi:hypothetical protein
LSGALRKTAAAPPLAALLLAAALLAAALLAALAGCGQTTTVTVVRPPNLGPPSGLAESSPLPAQSSYAPPHGSSTSVRFHSGSGCGKERWAVKTMTDPGAANVRPTPVSATIASLISLKPPVDPTDRVAPTEDSAFRVQAAIVLVKREADSDYHVVLEDPHGDTMIVESPSPACAAGSVAASRIAAVRKAFDAQFPQVASGHTFEGQVPATVAGVGFFDRRHGQAGVAPNGIELHPILSVSFRAAAGVPPAAQHVPAVSLGKTASAD